MIEETNATMAEATPVLEESPVLDETPVLEERPVQTENPAQQEAPISDETPAPFEAPVLEDTSGGEAPPAKPMPSAVQIQSASADVESTEDDEEKPVVRLLAVGQQLTGVVKRVSDFGAFVDIGVGRDGLVHISELSPRRVAKVTDVLQQGQEATFWIKKLDRDRNRISLTMIEPGTKTIRNMDKGDIVQGTVTRIMPYGAFVDIGIGRDALLHVREMGERFVAKPEDVVQVGELIDARILDISRRRARVDLSIKGLRPEPEPEPTPEPERKAAPAPEPEPEPADPFDEMEVLSPIEAALRKAMKESGAKLNLRKDNDRRSKKNDGARARAMQEEILSRTLTGSGKK
jgi:predicted RNA-binding protein with RPS1 domain